MSLYRPVGLEPCYIPLAILVKGHWWLLINTTPHTFADHLYERCVVRIQRPFQKVPHTLEWDWKGNGLCYTSAVTSSPLKS